MRILICDDNPEVRNQLYKYISDYFKKSNLKTPEISIFSSGEELLTDNRNKDILFLDIEMPGINGIHIGQKLKKDNNNIIIFIVTSFTEYLDDAMKFRVFRYLSKPIDKDRLYRNFKDALKLYNTFSTTICVETRTGIHTINISDIVIVETENSKAVIKTTTQR